MRIDNAFRPARHSSFLLVVVAILALILSTALAHLVPLQSVDGASHVVGIINPAAGVADESQPTSGDEPAPAHHEHLEVDHDGTISLRAMDTIGGFADAPPLVFTFAASSGRVPISTVPTRRDISAPSLTELSINRT
jgi:hypothetical protein